MKKYNVKLYYSTFTEREIEAETVEDAILKARETEPNFNKKDWGRISSFINNSEPWEDADSAEEIE
jgi:hypothetical protein